MKYPLTNYDWSNAPWQSTDEGHPDATIKEIRRDAERIREKRERQKKERKARRVWIKR